MNILLILLGCAVHAQEPRTSECTQFDMLKGAGKRKAWFDEQLAAGKEDFISMQNSQTSQIVCAW